MLVPLLRHVPKNYRSPGHSKTSSKSLKAVKQSKEMKSRKVEVTQLLNTKYIVVVLGTLWVKDLLTDHFVGWGLAAHRVTPNLLVIHAGPASFGSCTLESRFGTRVSHWIKCNGHGLLQKGTERVRTRARTAKLMGPRAWQGAVDAVGEKLELKLNHDVDGASCNVSLLSAL